MKNKTDDFMYDKLHQHYFMTAIDRFWILARSQRNIDSVYINSGQITPSQTII
jgi:hypothetical protein